MTQVIHPTPQDLRDRTASLQREEPKLRQRDVAQRLGVPEGLLVASRVGADVIRVRPEWKTLIEGLGAVGTVMALTRNPHAVIEKTGVYSRVEIDGHMGQVLDEDIDLRLFVSRWSFGYAVTDSSSRGTRRSLQIYDSSGTAIHKVYLEAESNAAAFDALIEAHRSGDQTPGEPACAPAIPISPRSDDAVDVAALVDGWSKLQNTHDFIFLLRKVGAAREQALRLAGREWAEPVDRSSYRQVLESAAATKLPIMVFVANAGIIEIHSGPIHHVKVVDGWVNVLDPRFSLHVHDEGVARAWVVRKPTSDGLVTSLELFDATGETVAYMFGVRKPGQRELEPWRAVLASLPRY